MQKQWDCEKHSPASPTVKASNARHLIGSALPSALIITRYSGSAEVDTLAVLEELKDMAADVAEGAHGRGRRARRTVRFAIPPPPVFLLLPRV